MSGTDTPSLFALTREPSLDLDSLDYTCSVSICEIDVANDYILREVDPPRSNIGTIISIECLYYQRIQTKCTDAVIPRDYR